MQIHSNQKLKSSELNAGARRRSLGKASVLLRTTKHDHDCHTWSGDDNN